MAVAYWRFAPWEPKIIFADDLANLWSFYDGYFASTIQQALLQSFVEKYRPVFQLICYFLFSEFDKTLWMYLAFNLFMQGINCVLFFIIAEKLAKDKFVVPFFLTLAFSTSRLALYQVTQVTGSVESVALTFFLITLYAVLQSLITPSPKPWQWIALLAITFAIYTHERYIVVIPWLALILFFTGLAASKLAGRSILVLACIAIIGSNYLIKVSLLHIPFFVGTGGSHITVNLDMIITHIQEAFFSIFGFNTGPGYLIGAPISLNPAIPGQLLLPWLMALLFSLSFLFVNTLGIFTSTKTIKNNFCYVLAGILLTSLLLIPPIFTIRVEGRWEYTPFMLILLSLAWSYGLPKQISNKIIGIICIVASLSSILVDNAICKSFGISKWWGGVYMVAGAKFSEAVFKDIMPHFILNQHSNKLLLLADNNSCDSVVALKFFEFYTKRKAILYCAKTENDLVQLMSQHPEALAFKYNNFLWKNYPYHQPKFLLLTRKNMPLIL